jgi:glyoxylase-like metal-dependent hydrolase (beta-lactamase superfamily II)
MSLLAPCVAHSLLPGVQMIQRGWLNCNQIVLRDAGGTVLVDTGYVTHAPRTLAALQALGVRPGGALVRILNTHCHSDHMGGNAALQRAFAAPIIIPQGELRHIDPWSPQSFWLEYFGQRAEPFSPTDTIAAGDAFFAAGLCWLALPAPGHDMDALMYWSPDERVLITGDALWQHAMGFVWPGEDKCMAAALATLDEIERLSPRLVLPGHGAPFTDLAATLAKVRDKLHGFARDPASNAWHVIKVMLAYALLDLESLPVADVPLYLARVPSYGDLNRQFLHRDPSALADSVVASLQRSGVIARAGDRWVPSIAA